MIATATEVWVTLWNGKPERVIVLSTDPAFQPDAKKYGDDLGGNLLK